MNPAQMMILESSADRKDDTAVSDLMAVLLDFYASRLEREMSRLADDGTLDNASLVELRGRHLRTPYRRIGKDCQAFGWNAWSTPSRQNGCQLERIKNPPQRPVRAS